jgi:hypothetical protein
MAQNQEMPDARAVLRQAYNTMPRRRFWRVLLIGIGLGVVIAVPLVALLMFHEGPWSGFLWDFLFRLPFAVMSFGFVVLIARPGRQRKWKEVLQGVLALGFFGTLTLFVWLQFARQLGGLVHFHRMQFGQLRSVTVECHSTDDPAFIGGIISDLRRAEWYSPDSHGWAPYAALTLRFTDGHFETYRLTEILAKGRLVLHAASGNSGLLAIPHLSVSLQRASLLGVSSHPRYDKPGFYEAIDPGSVCKNSAEEDQALKAAGALPSW